MSDSLEPAVEVVQHDRLDEWRRGIAATEKSIEEQRPIVAEERAKAQAEAQYGKRETLYLLCQKLASREGEPYRVRATVIAGLPEKSMSVWADGEGVTVSEAAEVAIHESRFRYAQALVAAKVEPSMEAGRERASKAELFMSDLRE